MSCFERVLLTPFTAIFPRVVLLDWLELRLLKEPRYLKEALQSVELRSIDLKVNVATDMGVA